MCQVFHLWSKCEEEEVRMNRMSVSRRRGGDREAEKERERCLQEKIIGKEVVRMRLGDRPWVEYPSNWHVSTDFVPTHELSVASGHDAINL